LIPLKLVELGGTITASISSPLNMWIYLAIGLYASLIFLMVTYNFESKVGSLERGHRKLQIATILMGIGLAVAGVKRVSLVQDDGTVMLIAGVFLLASQVLILNTVHSAYGTIQREVRRR